jgi:hypothetical protein
MHVNAYLGSVGDVSVVDSERRQYANHLWIVSAHNEQVSVYCVMHARTHYNARTHTHTPLAARRYERSSGERRFELRAAHQPDAAHLLQWLHDKKVCKETMTNLNTVLAQCLSKRRRQSLALGHHTPQQIRLRQALRTRATTAWTQMEHYTTWQGQLEWHLNGIDSSGSYGRIACKRRAMTTRVNLFRQSLW